MMGIIIHAGTFLFFNFLYYLELNFRPKKPVKKKTKQNKTKKQTRKQRKNVAILWI